MENTKVFIITVKENDEFLTVDNVKFAIEGCYPQLEITEIMEGTITPIDFDYDKELIKEKAEEVKKSWKKVLKEWKKLMDDY